MHFILKVQQTHLLKHANCLYFVGIVLKQTSMGYRREYTMIHLTVVGCAAFFMGVVICVGIYLCFHNWKSIRSYDLQKPANENVYDKPRFGSFASQLSLDFLTVNNKVYDSCTLSSRGTAVIKDNTFRKDKYNKNFPENMYATIRTNHSLRTEVQKVVPVLAEMCSILYNLNSPMKSNTFL